MGEADSTDYVKLTESDENIAKADPDPGPSVFHDFGCTHDPCRCRTDSAKPAHEASAYLVWQVDCPCGTVITYNEDGHPETCEDCGAAVTES